MEPAQEKPNKNHVILKFVLAVLIVILLTLVAYHTGFIKFFMSKQKMGHLLESLGPWSFVGFILLQAFQVVAAPIPGDATGFLGGYLYGPWLGILLSTIGLTGGSLLAFAFARAFGRPLVKKFVPPQALERFNFLLHHKGAFLVFLMFLLPCFPKDYLCYILGLGELSTMEFLAIGGGGRLFGTILLTLGGNYFRLHQYGRLGIVVGIGLAAIFVVWAYKDKLERAFRYWNIISVRKKRAKPALINTRGNHGKAPGRPEGAR